MPRVLLQLSAPTAVASGEQLDGAAWLATAFDRRIEIFVQQGPDVSLMQELDALTLDELHKRVACLAAVPMPGRGALLALLTFHGGAQWRLLLQVPRIAASDEWAVLQQGDLAVDSALTQLRPMMQVPLRPRIIVSANTGTVLISGACTPASLHLVRVDSSRRSSGSSAVDEKEFPMLTFDPGSFDTSADAVLAPSAYPAAVIRRGLAVDGHWSAAGGTSRDADQWRAGGTSPFSITDMAFIDSSNDCTADDDRPASGRALVASLIQRLILQTRRQGERHASDHRVHCMAQWRQQWQCYHDTRPLVGAACASKHEHHSLANCRATTA